MCYPTKGSISTGSRLRSVQPELCGLWLPNANVQPGLGGIKRITRSVGIVNVFVEEGDNDGVFCSPVSTGRSGAPPSRSGVLNAAKCMV